MSHFQRVRLSENVMVTCEPYHMEQWNSVTRPPKTKVLYKKTTMSQTMTQWRSLVNSQVLWTVHVMYQEGPKRLSKKKGQNHTHRGTREICSKVPVYVVQNRQNTENNPTTSRRQGCRLEEANVARMLGYDDDQKKSHTDYIQLSIQSQFNKRAL